MNEPVRQPVYAFEGFRLDAQRRVLFGVDGRPITLTPRLFDTLLHFVERAGQLLTKEQMLEAIWPNVIVEEHNLNKTVSELRRVLGEKPGEHKFIVTKPGHGYRFVADVSVDPSLVADRDALRQGYGDPSRAGAESASALSTVRPAVRPGTSFRRYWAAAILGAAALATGVAMFGFLGSSPSPPLRTMPWSVKKSGQWSPAWSPDGTAIAFVTLGTTDEPAELNIRGLNEPVGRPIASRSGRIPGIAQWTSTGKILFWEREGLWSVSPVGAPPELVVALDYQALGAFPPIRTMDVTRDGSTMAALARAEDGSPGIWTATPPSAKFEKYEPSPFAARAYHNAPFLRFSPDGKQLLLVWYPAGRGEEAWLMPFPPDANNPPHRVLEDMPLAVGTAEFSWLPDNRHVVVSTGREGPRSLYLADTRSGRFRALSTGLSDQTVPVVSPDGSKLIFQDNQSDFDIVTLDLRSGIVTDLIATDRSEFLPSWASGGDALVYLTDRNGAWQIWLHQSSQPDRPLVTARDFQTPTLYLIAPTFSPDGSRVIFDRVPEQSDEGARLWMSAVAGGAPERVTNEAVEEYAGSWSPDGAWYAYLATAREGGPVTLKKVKTTGQPTPVTLLEGLPGDVAGLVPIWSPDSRWLLVPNGGMMLVSPDGKTIRNLRIEKSPCAFADDEPILYCIRDTRPVEEHPLVALDFDGNVVRTIASVPRANMPASGLGPGLRLSPTPDRSGVTFAVERVAQNLWLMEGLDKVELP